MKNSKIMALSAVAVGLFVALFAVPLTLVAQTADGESDFASKLADKLGISSEQVDTALSEVREERQEERKVEVEAKVSEAVQNGELTDRQSQIMTAMNEVREANREENGDNKPEKPEGFEDMSEEEREAARETFRAERDQEMIDALAEKGLDVSADELDELQDTLKNLEIGGSNAPEAQKGGRGMIGGQRGQ